MSYPYMQAPQPALPPEAYDPPKQPNPLRRADFERMALWLGYGVDMSVDEDGDPVYASLHTQRAWDIWCAAIDGLGDCPSRQWLEPSVPRRETAGSEA